MTKVYGATIGGTVDWLWENSGITKEMTDGLGIEFNKTLTYGAKKLFVGVGQVVPSADDAMNWLRSVAAQMPNGHRMEWTVPTGFKVQHDYQSFSDRRIDVKSSCFKQLTVREFDEGTDKNRMRNAISPNFVHALDAAHLMFTSHDMQAQGLSMVAIHDSFGTHPAYVDSMHSSIRNAFVKLYQNEDFLRDWLFEVQAEGEPPRLGKLNLEEVKDSEFFFS